jgi:ketopantoate reductase
MMRPAIGPETFVVPLQNGVDAASELAMVLGSGHALAGLCGTFSWVTAPGRIRSVGSANFKFGIARAAAGFPALLGSRRSQPALPLRRRQPT